MRHDYERDMARLETAQRRAEQHLALQHERMNQRFNYMRQKFAQKYENTSVSQQKIVDAALELLREEGLNNLSLRKLAAKLDMKAPALYWHFNNKEVLVDYMADGILRKEFPTFMPISSNYIWQDWLVNQMLTLRKAMLAYPDGGRVVAGAHLQPTVTLGKLFENILDSLMRSGFNIRQSRHILMTVTTYTFGFVIEEQSGPTSDEQAMLDKSWIEAAFPLILESMKDAHLNRQNVEQDYLTGLNYIIQGATTSEKASTNDS